jgi:hypothetical protein
MAESHTRQEARQSEPVETLTGASRQARGESHSSIPTLRPLAGTAPTGWEALCRLPRCQSSSRLPDGAPPARYEWGEQLQRPGVEALTPLGLVAKFTLVMDMRIWAASRSDILALAVNPSCLFSSPCAPFSPSPPSRAPEAGPVAADEEEGPWSVVSAMTDSSAVLISTGAPTIGASELPPRTSMLCGALKPSPKIAAPSSSATPMTISPPPPPPSTDE